MGCCLPLSCTHDADCGADYWCRREAGTRSGEVCSNTRVCVPKRTQGQSCSGYIPPCYDERCLDHLECRQGDPNLADAPGVCGLPQTHHHKGCATGPCPSDSICSVATQLGGPLPYVCTPMPQQCCEAAPICPPSYPLESQVPCSPHEADTGLCVWNAMCCSEVFCRVDRCKGVKCGPNAVCVMDRETYICVPTLGVKEDDSSVPAWAWVVLALGVAAVVAAAVAVGFVVRSRLNAQKTQPVQAVVVQSTPVKTVDAIPVHANPVDKQFGEFTSKQSN